MPTATRPSVDFGDLIGDLYARWTLDFLTELAYAVSMDFITRPQLFTGGDIPSEIVNLRMEWGTSPKFPNTAQRAAMMTPLFGKSDAQRPDTTSVAAPFAMARHKFLDACVAFSERAVDSGLEMLEERVRSAIVPFKAYFESLRGRSVEQSGLQLAAVSHAAFDVLTAPGVARVYGVAPPHGGWPITGDDTIGNANGAKLVEAAGAALAIAPDYRFTYMKFILLQRVAREGERTLPKLFTVDPAQERDLKSLISLGYTWASSLRDFQQAA